MNLKQKQKQNLLQRLKQRPLRVQYPAGFGWLCWWAQARFGTWRANSSKAKAKVKAESKSKSKAASWKT
jgi:hypothetical protein